MATIGNDPNGHRRILFVAPDGSRKTVRLGKCDRKTAETVCRHVEQLLNAKLNGDTVSRQTAQWLSEIGEQLRERLAAVGLVEALAKVPTLQEFLDEYLTTRAAELKPGTMIVLRQAARHMVRLLGENTRMDKITPMEADRYRASLLQGRAKATVNKWCRYAREFLTAAQRRGMVESNPFGHLRGLAVTGNAARRVLVGLDDINRVLETIPCPQFRLIVALARFAGMRCPSEVLALTWADVNWDHNRLIVRASKTEHHADGGVRVVPLFKELRPHLESAWEQAEDGQTYVITRYRDPKQNLRTQFNRWVLQAGLTPWPKPFQNMRATRATELADQFPSHVASKWLGHTERIADDFYRSVTDEHYSRAAGIIERGTESGTRAAQNQAQQINAGKCKEVIDDSEVLQESEDTLLEALPCRSTRNILMGGTGLEPTAFSGLETAILDGRGTESGTVAQMDPDLRSLIAVWPILPASVRDTIVGLVNKSFRGF